MAVTARLTPRQSVQAECARRGRDAVVAGCVDILEARDVDDSLVLVLGGPPAEYVLNGREGGRDGYWPRVWAARGLLHVWDDRAVPALIDATRDEAWRVREMASKVIARHEIADGMEAVIRLRDDQVARVREAARKAVERLTVAGA